MSIVHIRIPQELDEQMAFFLKKNNDWIPSKSQLVRMSIEHFLESCDHLRKMIGNGNPPTQDKENVNAAKSTTATVAVPADNKEVTLAPASTTTNDESFDVLGDFN